MSDVPVQLIVAAYQDEKAAKAALKELKRASKDGLIKIDSAAVLRKDEKGKLHIKETHDFGGGKGAVLGGVVGGAIGLLAGPLLVVPVAVGALIGGLGAKMRSTDFDHARLKAIGDGMTHGSSAIIAVVEHKWVELVEQALAEAEADIMTAAISADVAQQLEAGHEVGYTVITSQEGITAGRVATGDDMVEGQVLTVDDGGVYSGQFVATEEGFAVRQIASDGNVVVDETVVGIMDDQANKG